MPARHPIHDQGPARGEDSTALPLDAQLFIGEGQFIDLPVRFGYRRDAPFAVVLEFPDSDEAVGTWVFSRDLLWEGLHKPAGLGDVRIWPPCQCHGRRALRIMLAGRDGTALLDVPVKPLRSWLRKQSFALVPRGTEAELIDWDAELSRLVGGR
ncbi:SsgA family sporulation/cell division regulator [Kitasatospora sp. RB6PN24]|uniref:SsgA family sporulation/cell division regulator n=1 Tax=Kitasatospora humi TaxID=2893891 RepID=UPI001E4C19B7|nr:SsgA family sporulation/cell division regulator [Kitasatospora humi]MCC9311465.1 SsgA family sporulation/cell division regulator [Kitasatospora humi]